MRLFMNRILLFLVAIYFISGCKNEEIIFPTVITNPPSEVTPTTAVFSGEVLTIGNVQIFDYGFVWSMNEMPTTESSTKLFGKNGVVGKFETPIINLTPATHYFIRTVLNTSEGIIYGQQETFFTEAISLPEIKTFPSDKITPTSARLKGEIVLGNVTVLDYGFVWSKNELPTTEDNSKFFGKPETKGGFEFIINNLMISTDYFVRTILITPSGIIYGNQEKFTTQEISIGTMDANSITFSSAYLSGQLNDYGSLTINDHGFVWSTSPGVNINTSNKISLGSFFTTFDFDFNLKDLNELTIYYFNTFLITDFGVIYGEEKTFLTLKGPWTKIANFPGTPRTNAIAFTINGKGYIGLGNGVGFIPLKDLWEYDPSKNEWIQKSDFDGEARSAAVAFTIGNKAFVGTGGYSNVFDDMWEYSAELDQWIQKSNFPGGLVYYASAFSIENFGYVGTGIRNGTLLKEFWQYDISLDNWTSKADFGGMPVDASVGFSIGGKGYIGTGNLQSGSSKEFWQYDPSQNKWSQKSSLPNERWIAVSFVLNNKGYVGLGNGSPTDIISKYDPLTNAWSNGPTFPGGQREAASTFVINNKAYIGLGSFDKIDFWEYDHLKDKD
jgi:N-acetylneuraminic acid mutarotase